ncbi:hypothetical protein DID96_08865 [Burkholderia sp. Bp8963]|uniref:hypothetical protein n=1 Tax=Burkholderia sp. Bp8963 TaxID=2184547 RepID=UPI000F5985F8|nr:hypothetical protein [Burkholderia sp. Bp8963]RQS72963.1 hypothetical protein DID96_08865 [Burkholderia sp. Bp8963]
MHFLVDWFIVLAVLTAAALFLFLRAPRHRYAPEIGRKRRIDSARLITQAILGFWTAALIVARGILGTAGADASPAGFAAFALAAFGLASVSTYWTVLALRLRRTRTLFTRH